MKDFGGDSVCFVLVQMDTVIEKEFVSMRCSSVVVNLLVRGREFCYVFG